MTVRHLDLANPAFSIRSQVVREARDQSWYATTPYGIAVLRYEDVGFLLKDLRLRQGSYKWPAHNKATGAFADWWARMMLNRVGEDHARLRRLINPAFSPKLIAKLQPQFEAIANDLIDRFGRRGHCEFTAEFAEPYATRVICELIGLPQTEWQPLAELSAEMGISMTVNFGRLQARVNAATVAMTDYARRVLSERRGTPREDFISWLIGANEDKDKLSDIELEDMVVLSIFGGIDTTRNQLGLALSMMIDNPSQWGLLAERPELARAAVEEIMRTRPVTTWVTREALEDFDYKGVTISGGTTLHLFTESAGTDPSVFAPGFDITVQRKPHYGFGSGAHHCPGHFIARGDMTEALKILARRLRNPAYDGEVEWLPDSGNTGANRLPIRFDPEPAA